MSSPEMPLLSIVTVCRNAAEVLEKTLCSVLSQDYPALEYHVIDGASTDSTSTLLKKYAPLFSEKGIVFRVVSETDAGIYDAMNKGIRAARGEWINFMNAGDAFASPDAIRRLFLPQLSATCGVVYGNVVLHKAFGLIEIKPKPLAGLEKKMVFCHQSAFVRSHLLSAHLFELRYRLAADYESFRFLWKQGVEFSYRDVAVAIFEAEEGVSSSNRLRVNREKAQIRGIDQTWQWRLGFFFKCMGVSMKRVFQNLIPQTWIQHIRKANYQRHQRRREKNIL